MARVNRSERAALQILTRVGEAYRLSAEQLREKTAPRPARDRAMHAIRAELRWPFRAIAELMHVAPSTADRACRRQAKLESGAPASVIPFRPVGQVPALRPTAIDPIDDMTEIELRAYLRRITGCDLALRIVDRLGLNTYAAIVLSILAESYPRIVHIQSICSLYEGARDRLGFGRREKESIGENLINVSVMEIRKAFMTVGWPDPIEVKTKTRRLTDAVACWMSAEFGAPNPQALPDKSWRSMAKLMSAHQENGSPTAAVRPRRNPPKKPQAEASMAC